MVVNDTIITVLGQSVSYSGEEVKKWHAIDPYPERPVNGGVS